MQCLIGGLSLGAGFVRAEVPLIVLRVLTGIGAALTVPSALHLIVHMFPDTGSQAKAIAAFGDSAAFGNGFWIEYSSLTARNCNRMDNGSTRFEFNFKLCIVDAELEFLLADS
ncbi:hypothetical protein B0H14DRAFT_1178205 [Mycena olivaceomarginata]|nr:hypothetical protein B0H14DRAFT_1178205 [Mycena olivaceomarginata]